MTDYAALAEQMEAPVYVLETEIVERKTVPKQYSFDELHETFGDGGDTAVMALVYRLREAAAALREAAKERDAEGWTVQERVLQEQCNRYYAERDDALLRQRTAEARVRELERENERLKGEVGHLTEAMFNHDAKALAAAEAMGRAEMRKVLGEAFWQFVDYLRTLGKRFEDWPVSLKNAFSEAIVDRTPPTPDDITRTIELAKELGWEVPHAD